MGLVSTILCVISVFTRHPLHDAKFSTSFVSFTCFLSVVFLSSLILIFNAGWNQQGVPQEERNQRIKPIGWLTSILFFLGILMLFIAYALLQTATSTLVICPILFIGILASGGYLFYVDYSSPEPNSTTV